MKRIFVLFAFFFYSTYIFTKPLELEINANNAILMNADNNRVLFEKNAYREAYPASITKTVCIWYVIENFSNYLNNYLTASENALKVISPEAKISSNYHLSPYLLESDGSHFDIQLYEKLTLNDLLHGMVVVSGNDAANVVAENLAGSIEVFMKNLNEYLKQKGCLNTNLCNPHGLHMPNHITTAYDIAYIMKMALKNPKFLEIFSCKFFIRPKTNKLQKKEVITSNKLLKPGKHYYKYAICAKTGYHSRAKYNLLSVAKKDDRTLIAVVFGCPSNDSRYEDTIELFNKAFLEKKITKKIFDKEKLFLAKIEGASKIVKTRMKDDLFIDYYPAEEIEIKAQILWDDLLKAPIKKGQKIACIQIITKENEIIKKQNIYAISDVKRSFLMVLKDLFIKK